MGALRHGKTGRTIPLAADQLLGRGAPADIRIDSPRVSAQHARLRWDGGAWEAIDLGSRNGTFVAGKRITEATRLGAKDELGFGDATDPWILADDGPPTAVAYPEEGGDPIAAVNGVLSLATEGTVKELRLRGRNWVLDDGGERPVHDLAIIAVGRRRFRFRSDAAVERTREDRVRSPKVSDLDLRFVVSRDEEHVEISVVQPGGVTDLPASNHYYLLLTLARARAADGESAAIAEAEQGWLYADELAQRLGLHVDHLNVTIFRVRKLFERAGVQGAASIIERRRTTGQLRIGTARFAIRSK